MTPKIGLGLQRVGCPEKHVLQIGGQHGAAPPVGNGRPGSLFHQVLVILIHADVGAVHDFDDLSVDVSGQARRFSSISHKAVPVRVSGISIHPRFFPIH
jgi:hypothetical protein